MGEGCLEKQREIDRLKEENQRLKQNLNQNQRKLTEGFLTPQPQVPKYQPKIIMPKGRSEK